MNPIMRLADAIERGHPMIGEEKQFMPLPGDPYPCGCALTAGWYGLGKVAADYWPLRHASNESVYQIFARILKIDVELIRAISRKHSDGIPRLEIASWLRTLPEAQESADAHADCLPETTRVLEPVGKPAGIELPESSNGPVRSADYEWATEQVNKLLGVTV